MAVPAAFGTGSWVAARLQAAACCEGIKQGPVKSQPPRIGTCVALGVTPGVRGGAADS
jgi:hypothetical protein